jgi:hypothetical protein
MVNVQPEHVKWKVMFVKSGVHLQQVLPVVVVPPALVVSDSEELKATNIGSTKLKIPK